MQQANINKVGDGMYTISGSLVYESVPTFAKDAEKVLDFSTDTVLDLSDVKLVNSAGIALFVDWYSRFLRQRGKLRFTNISDHLKQLVNVNGLDQLFTS